MKQPSRFSSILHILVHLAQRPGEPFTSDQLAGWWNTNPVVVRRSFAPLREAGIIQSIAGHGGGWMLAKPAAEISLGTIYDLLGERLIDPDREENTPQCLVERTVHHALRQTYEEANTLLKNRLATISLQDLANDVATIPRDHHPRTGDPHHVS
jgi:Rrf2 family protein